jgi:hypothetical protein
MSTLDEWTELVCLEFGLPSGAVDTRLVLGVARDVAHDVARPAAPLTAYLLGLAVANGHPAESAAARISALAAGWDESGRSREDAEPD